MKPLFFVACVPRCGSQWLTGLLNTAPGIRCYHPPAAPVKHMAQNEIQLMIDSWHGKDPRPYLRESREQMAQFAEREAPDARGWGEVNEFIRYSVPEVRELFDVPVAGLIRNGHLTIPSLVRRHFYNLNKAGEWTSAIKILTPYTMHYKQTDESRGWGWATWPHMTPFERCCWLWANSYQRLIDQGVPVFTLESLNAEFGNVERLCEVLGISISYEDWQERAGKPVDDFYQGRPRPPLPPDQLEMFDRWAGDVQEHFYG